MLISDDVIKCMKGTSLEDNARGGERHDAMSRVFTSQLPGRRMREAIRVFLNLFGGAVAYSSASVSEMDGLR